MGSGMWSRFSSSVRCLAIVVACAVVLSACGDDDTHAPHTGVYRLDRREYVRDFVAMRIEQHADKLRALSEDARQRTTRTWMDEATARVKTLAVKLTLDPKGQFTIARRVGKSVERHGGRWSPIAGGVRLQTTHMAGSALEHPYAIDADSDGVSLHIDRSDMDQPVVLRRVRSPDGAPHPSR